MAKSKGHDASAEREAPASPAERRQCGIVMPISAVDGCSEQHWFEVKAILVDAVESAGFNASLVSDADDVGIIQKRIIQNLYENPVVVCDVSGKNPNVMFELGMRLAFDKPTIIIKDDRTTYSFDTSPIEHLEYPRDLRFGKIVGFKTELAHKVKATYDKATKDPGYTTFLKHFGRFTVAKLETTEVSKEDYILEQIKELRDIVLRRDSTGPTSTLMTGHTPSLFSQEITVTGKTVISAIDEILNNRQFEIHNVDNIEDIVKHIISEISSDHRFSLMKIDDIRRIANYKIARLMAAEQTLRRARQESSGDPEADN